MNLAPTLTLPIPLPHWQSSMAPHFNSKTLSTLSTYLLDYESLAEAAQLSPEEQLAQSTCYLTGEDKDNQENLQEYEATSPNWTTFKEALFWEYIPWTNMPPSMGNLGVSNMIGQGEESQC